MDLVLPFPQLPSLIFCTRLLFESISKSFVLICAAIRVQAEEEAYLPRGGSGRKSAPSAKPQVAPGEGENLFSSASTKPQGSKKSPANRSKPKQRRPSHEDTMDVDEASDSDSGDNISKHLTDSSPPARVEYLRFSSLAPGMLFLGCIKEINEFDIVVSLPNNLKGFIKITEISDTYLKRLEKEIARQQSGAADDETVAPIAGLSEFFHLGQYVRCVLLRLDEAKDSKRIELSMREAILNRRSPLSSLRAGQVISGSIASSEDHGYVVSLGIKGATGFLLKKNAPARHNVAADADSALPVGLPVDFSVSSVDMGTKTVYLDGSLEKIATTVVRRLWFLSGISMCSLSSLVQTHPDDVAVLDNLRPGMLVKAGVGAVVPGGLWLKFLDYFTGIVDLLHLDKVASDGLEGLKKLYRVGQKLRARILYIDFENKTVGLSLLPHLVKLGSFEQDAPEIGSIFEDAKIARIDVGVGLVLSIPSHPQLSAYVHVRISPFLFPLLHVVS